MVNSYDVQTPAGKRKTGDVYSAMTRVTWKAPF